MSKVAVVGGGGCFALNFTRHLEKLGIEHFGIGRSGPKAPPFWLAPKDYRFYPLHIVDQITQVMMILDMEKPDVIVNYAAQGEGAASFGATAPDFFRTNTLGLAVFVRELIQRDYVKRFIQIGTSEIYGSTEAPAKEDDPIRATSPYAISKAAFDEYLKVVHRIEGFPMNIIRPSNCVVEGQQLWRIVPKAAICALAGRKLPLHGGGKAAKSYLHADDLSRAVMAVLEKGTLGKVYNVAPAGPVTIRALVNHVIECCGKIWDEVVEETGDRVGQDARYALDATAIAKDCGWTQTVGWTRAAQRVIDWVREWPELLDYPTDYEHRR